MPPSDATEASVRKSHPEALNTLEGKMNALLLVAPPTTPGHDLPDTTSEGFANANEGLRAASAYQIWPDGPGFRAA